MRELTHELPDWDQVKSVFLDMDGTLLDLHFDNHFWLEHVPLRYGERRGLSMSTPFARCGPLAESATWLIFLLQHMSCWCLHYPRTNARLQTAVCRGRCEAHIENNPTAPPRLHCPLRRRHVA